MVDLVQVYSSKGRHRKLLCQLTCIRLLEHLEGLLAGEILADFETGLRLRVLILLAPLRCLHDRGHWDCIWLLVRFIAQIWGGGGFQTPLRCVEWGFGSSSLEKLILLCWLLFYRGAHFFMWLSYLLLNSNFCVGYRWCSFWGLPAFMR